MMTHQERCARTKEAAKRKLRLGSADLALACITKTGIQIEFDSNHLLRTVLRLQASGVYFQQKKFSLARAGRST